jgi:hypothetical protein
VRLPSVWHAQVGGRDMGNCPASDEARFDRKEYAGRFNRNERHDDGTMMNRLEKARALQHEPRVAAEVHVAAKRHKQLLRVCNAALTKR